MGHLEMLKITRQSLKVENKTKMVEWGKRQSPPLLQKLGSSESSEKYGKKLEVKHQNSNRPMGHDGRHSQVSCLCYVLL